MRSTLQFLGLAMLLQGISGAIDHLAVQPFFGAFLNLFNRVVIPRVDFLSGHELLANLTLARRRVRGGAPHQPGRAVVVSAGAAVQLANRRGVCLAMTSKSWSRWRRAAPLRTATTAIRQSVSLRTVSPPARQRR